MSPFDISDAPAAALEPEHASSGNPRALLTPAQCREIAATYDGTTEMIEALVKKFGVKRHNIHSAALRGGYATKRKRMTWTAEKKAYLKANFGRVPVQQIAAHLGCTPVAIGLQKKRMGLSSWAVSGEIGYNIRELEQLTKIDHRLWLRYIEAGELKAHIVVTFDESRPTRVCSVDDLHRFLSRRPEFLLPRNTGLDVRAALELFRLPEPPRYKQLTCRSAAFEARVIQAAVGGPVHHGEWSTRAVQTKRASVPCSEEPFVFWAPLSVNVPVCPRCGSLVSRFSESRTYRDDEPGEDDVLRMLAGKIGLGYENGALVDGAGMPVGEEELLRYAFAAKREPKIAFRVFARLIERGLTPVTKRRASVSTWRDASLVDYDLRPRQVAEFERFKLESNVCITWPPGEGKMFFLAWIFGLIPGRHALFVNSNTLAQQWVAFLIAHVPGARVTKRWKPSFLQVTLPGADGAPHAVIDVWGYQTRHGFETERYCVVGYDEAHYLPGTSAHRVALLPSLYRVGLTATPYREDGRAALIHLLTGDFGLETWADVLADREHPRAAIDVVIVDDLASKFSATPALIPAEGRGIVFVDAIDDGKRLAELLGVPFIFSETKDRLAGFYSNRIVVCSRVGDHGLDITDLAWLVEFGFHKGSRMQQLQRHGRLLHSREAIRHTILMTRKELTLYSKRLSAIEAQGLAFRLRVHQ